MIDDFLDFFKNISKSRILYLVIAYLFLAAILIHRIFVIQVVEKEKIVKKELPVETVKRETKAARGNIYDKNGVLLAYNKLSYNITMSNLKKFESNEEQNNMLYRLIQIIERNGGKLAPDFYIEKDKRGKLIFNVKGASELRFKRDAYTQKSIEDLTLEQKKATAEEVYLHLKQGKYMFGIKDEFDVDESLKIMKLRFALLLNKYNKNPINIATNVDERTVAAIKEDLSNLPGVEILGHTYRYYNESKYFSHILGYTGNINETELSEDKEKYYTSSDQIGKTGLEYTFEKVLRGKKGEEEAIINPTFDVTDVKVLSKPEPGNDIYLTVDSKLQKAAYHILERGIAKILLSRIHNSTTTGAPGRTTSQIMIPIYDVYYAFFNNNIIDFKSLSEKDATDAEKKVYEKFIVNKDEVIKQLKGILKVNDKTQKKEAGDKISPYLGYIFSFMEKEEMIYPKQLNKKDAFYKEFANDEKSLSEFLKYLISKKMINLDLLGIGNEYLSTEEIFDKIVSGVFSALENDTDFIKMIYKSLIYNRVVSGSEVGLILYDQGYFKKDNDTYDKLLRGELSSYGFMRSKIKSLEIKPSDLALDPCSGSMVITDVKTGKVRAMATYPSYDNNKLANQIDAVYYQKLQNDLSFPLINRPCQQKTAPGSTFKPISSVAILDTKTATPTETVRDEVVFEKTDRPAKCWSNVSHGSLNVVDALEVSCNYYFYEKSYEMSLNSEGKYNSRLGLDKLNHYAGLFGLKEGETSGVELYEYEPSISDTDSVRSAIGQGSYAFTPTQIARYTTGLANKGILNYLTLIEEIKNIDGKKVENTISKAKKEKSKLIPLSDTTWNTVHKGLYQVTHGSHISFNRLFEGIDATIAGKTGTAEFSDNRGNHALFTSFAPFENPEISATVVLPFAYRSPNAAMVCADFYRYYFGERDDSALVTEKLDEIETVIHSD